STSLTSNIEITAASYSNVPGLSTLTFTATKSTALVMFSASGFAYTNSMANVLFRVRNTTNNSTIGGTNTTMQSYDDVTGTITPWSCTFTKVISGLTVGNSYTLRVQGYTDGIFGTLNAVVWPSTHDSHHMTLSVLQ
ncbi:MAG: hypothetical protein WD267_01790, partial [Balneolales bacterium]